MYELPEELVLKVIEGERMAFNELYELIYKRIYYLAYNILQNEADAKDAVADTMLRVYESIYTLREAKSCYNWICTILVNECKKRLRHYKKRETSIDDVELVSNSADNTEEITDMKRALKSLSDEERMIVLLSAVQGYKGEEIASMMNMKHSTVRSKYRRSIVKLKSLMKGDGQNDRRRDAKTNQTSI